MGKCKRCGRRYPNDKKGKFPKHYFDHRKKFHPGISKRSKNKRSKGSKGHRGGRSFEHSTKGAKYLTLTFHD